MWDLLVDRQAVPLWSPMDSCRLDRAAAGDDPDGVGSVRRQTMGRTVGFDTITELDPPRRFAYTNTGLPVRDYHAQVELTATADGGCLIVWKSRFVPKYPLTGAFAQRAITRFLTGCVTGLAGYSQRH